MKCKAYLLSVIAKAVSSLVVNVMQNKLLVRLEYILHTDTTNLMLTSWPMDL